MTRVESGGAGLMAQREHQQFPLYTAAASTAVLRNFG